MKQLLLSTLIALSSSSVSAREVYQININRACAAIVGIPYASDNFTDEEWEQFQECISFIKQYQN